MMETPERPHEVEPGGETEQAADVSLGDQKIMKDNLEAYVRDTPSNEELSED